MVAVGTFMSAFWILSANSWMQTPAGYAINEVGQFVPADWWTVIFNPSFPYRLVHMVLAAYLTTAFVVGAVGALHLLREPRHRARTDHVLDGHVDGGPGGAGADRRRRPARPEHAGTSAGEDRGDRGPFRDPAGAPLILFGMPDMAEGRTDLCDRDTLLGSLILTHDWNGDDSRSR